MYADLLDQPEQFWPTLEASVLEHTEILWLHAIETGQYQLCSQALTAEAKKAHKINDCLVYLSANKLCCLASEATFST